jgi:D-alanine-D-alanine ligase
MKKQIIGVIYGGRSGEHEVSVLSGQRVAEALKYAGFRVVEIFVDKFGRWSVSGKKVILSPNPGDGLLYKTSQKRIPVDIFFPVLHGTYGEDGTIQGVFEMTGVPYVGAGVLGSAVGMDKEAQKLLYVTHGIPTVHFEVIRRKEWQVAPNEWTRRITRSIGYPCFIKPANLGSSVGVHKVKREEHLKKAVADALRYDTKVIVEDFIAGREVLCGVIGNDKVRVSLPGEVIPKREFYDYIAKYVADDTEYRVAIPLADGLRERVMRLAARVYEATFCEGYARVDFFLTPSEELFVVEINTIPGFTSHSMFPRLWEASGLPLPDLVSTLVQLGWERHRERSALETSWREGKLLKS